MKKTKLAVAGLLVALSMTSVSAFAAFKTVPEITADLTGKDIETVLQEQALTGKSWYQLAEEAGKTEEFQQAIIEQKKEALKEQVAQGFLTQEQADSISSYMDTNQANGNNYGNGYGYGHGGYGHGGFGGGFGRCHGGY